MPKQLEFECVWMVRNTRQLILKKNNNNATSFFVILSVCLLEKMLRQMK